MGVTIQNTIADYHKFFRYYCFKRNLAQRLFIFFLLTLFCSFPCKNFILGDYLKKLAFNFIILNLFFFLIPYVITIILFKKNLFQKKILLGITKIITTDSGIKIESSDNYNKFCEWSEIKRVENSTEYIFLSFKIHRSILISKLYFNSENDATKFYEIINNEVLKSNAINKIKDGNHLYRFGLLGLIPNVGIIAGIVLLFKGLFTYKDKKLVVIGIADVLFTFIFWYSVSHIVDNSKSNNDSLTIMAQSKLNSITKDIEFYKIKYGNYPDSLEQATKDDKFAFIYDPFLSFSEKGNDVSYHYKKIRDKYTLFSVGIDKIPNSSDDIYPTSTKGDTTKFGLIKK